MKQFLINFFRGLGAKLLAFVGMAALIYGALAAGKKSGSKKALQDVQAAEDKKRAEAQAVLDDVEAETAGMNDSEIAKDVASKWIKRGPRGN